jgi:hypothetical protein
VTLGEAVTAVCQHYDYRLEDIYSKSFADGGLTYGQISVLFKHYEKRLVRTMEFEAAIAGAEIKKDAPDKKEVNMLFKSPEDYEKLSKEEQEELTQQMKENWSLTSFGAMKTHGR